MVHFLSMVAVASAGCGARLRRSPPISRPKAKFELLKTKCTNDGIFTCGKGWGKKEATIQCSLGAQDCGRKTFTMDRCELPPCAQSTCGWRPNLDLGLPNFSTDKLTNVTTFFQELAANYQMPPDKVLPCGQEQQVWETMVPLIAQIDSDTFANLLQQQEDYAPCMETVEQFHRVYPEAFGETTAEIIASLINLIWAKPQESPCEQAQKAKCAEDWKLLFGNQTPFKCRSKQAMTLQHLMRMRNDDTFRQQWPRTRKVRDVQLMMADQIKWLDLYKLFGMEKSKSESKFNWDDLGFDLKEIGNLALTGLPMLR